mgnify:CR=1 FL=1
MGNCKSNNNNIIYNYYSDIQCPICLDNIIHICDTPRCYCINDMRTIKSPCCLNYFHKDCWTKCLNLNGHCPLCRYKHIPDKYMDHIRFCQQYDRVHTENSEVMILSTTHIWGRNGYDGEKDDQGKDILGNEQAICFTDDLYWE